MGASDLIKALQNTLRGGGSSLIAARPSRPECCPARVLVLSAVSRAAATSGPVRKCGHCKVHNGLTRAHGPDRAIACTLARGRHAYLECLGTRSRRTTLASAARASGTVARIATCCAGEPPTCAPRRRAPCPDRSAAQWLWPRSSGVAVVSHGEGSRLRLRTSVCGQVRRRIWKCVRYDRSRLTGIGAASARGGHPRLEIERSDWAPQLS